MEQGNKIEFIILFVIFLIGILLLTINYEIEYFLPILLIITVIFIFLVLHIARTIKNY